ncbi:MAG: CCA tRNA nucleotidyltransferase [Candidatus Hydrogenedentes bacterium]|nr:CCA tRNA nucleotidyltransferase [Candidatus Hydrogenedentota bacterium]
MDDPRKAAERICETLRNAGHRALFAGGCVRDELLGRAPKDYDVATSAHPDEVERLFERVVSVGAAFGVQVVLMPEDQCEVATFRSEGPYLDGRHPASVEFHDEKQDALRRDFTINALFLDPETGEVLDYVGGREDLARRVVRAVGDPHKRFQEDHLRLLRAVRIAAQLDFALDEATLEAVKTHAGLIAKTSSERIRDEILRILTQNHAHRGFEMLDETGLLRHVLPEIADMKGVEQPPEYHPEGDVFVHTLKILERLRDPSPALAMAALLHDVGKPRTQTFADRIRFDRHEKVGADIAKDICERLRMSTHDIARIEWIVGQHMRVSTVKEMRESKLKRLIREEGFAELLELFRIDCLSSHNRLDTYEWLRDYAENLSPEEVKPPVLLSGHDLIEMGYRPGPDFAKILTAVEDKQLEGELSSPEQARDYVRTTWPLET